MFEKLTGRAGTAARRRVRARIDEMAGRMGAALPSGVTAEASGDGVVLSGRGLVRRLVLDPALRWLTENLR